MKSVFSTTALSRVLFTGALVVLFTAGCCKHEDDCPAPESNDDQVTTRAFEASEGQNVNKGVMPAGATCRGAEAGEGDNDGGGISDDGDDEADGEGNKKGRVQH